MSITLQINLSPGDLRYGAHLTVPALITAHRAEVDRILLVVDCCKPQRTKIVDPAKRYPEPEFTRNVEAICALASQWHQQGICTDLYIIRPDDPLLDTLRSRYLRNIIRETHNYGGTGLLAYLAGLELPETRFVLHYDADMLLFQGAGYDWSSEAVGWFARYPDLVGVTPRVCPPPLGNQGGLNGSSYATWPPVTAVEGGWKDKWFSTRCLLVDRLRLAGFLPLLQGRALIETLVVKWLRRGHPRSPEVLLSHRIRGGGGWRMNLATESAWLIHPPIKHTSFVELLPRLLESVHMGQVPDAQRGYPELDLAAWANYLSNGNDAHPADCRS